MTDIIITALNDQDILDSVRRMKELLRKEPNIDKILIVCDEEEIILKLWAEQSIPIIIDEKASLSNIIEELMYKHPRPTASWYLVGLSQIWELLVGWFLPEAIRLPDNPHIAQRGWFTGFV